MARRDKRISQPTIPRRVFAVIAPLVFVAFLVGVQLSTTLTERLAPYVYFGRRVAPEHITMLKHYRHIVIFSNGDTVHGLRLLRLDLIFCLLSTVFILGLFFAFLYLAASIIRRRDRAWADDVLHFTRFAEENTKEKIPQ